MIDAPRVSCLLLVLLFGCASPVESEVVGLVRLTATQWENATADLLGLPAPSGLSAGFLPDPAAGRFDTNSAELQVTPVLQQQLLSASVQLARETVTDEDRYARVVGTEDAWGVAMPDPWLSSFGRRAFRRSLTPGEQEVYRNLFHSAPAVFPEADPFTAGVQLSIVGFLQSPHFLYRVERVLPGSVELEPISFASKLSFSLWNGPPDEDLLAAAEQAGSAGELLDEVPRLMEDTRFVPVILDLHRQMLHTEAYTNIPREFVSYEDYETTLNAAMQAEVDTFVEEIVLSGGTVADLLTSRQTWADSQIAAIYGIEGIEGQGVAGLEPVTLDPDQRAGLLTMSGFLAVHSSERSENLIRRSAFVHESMLCTSLPPPPPEATALPPGEGEQTARERIEEHTSTCGGACHQSLINPIAFAFGQYDETGRYRGDDSIDTRAVYGFSFGETAFDGAVDLAELLAEDADLHRCYASHLLSYLEGRTLTADDAPRLDALADASMDGEPILSLITDVVRHEDFRAVRR